MPDLVLLMAQVKATYLTSITVDANDNDPAVANLNTLRSKLQTALTTNTTYLALATPTTAQNTAQIQALSRQMDALIRLIANQLDSTSGT
jgi:uncharacterized protein involved in exopolysaccharide biosynthesis